MSGAIFAAILVTLGMNWWIIRPLFATYREGVGEDSWERQQLVDQKERCLQVLRDLELDHATQKIGDHDYQNMRRQVSYELAGILSRIDSQH